jgi:sugar lactone lactonase YvrE
VSTLYSGTPSVIDGFKGITRDGAGNLYIADRGACAIYKLTPQGEFSTLAGGERGYVDAQGTAAKFHYPEDLVFAPDGALYVADSYNHRIRKVTLGGDVTTFAGSTDGKGDGTTSEAKFSIPSGITVDPAGTFYVTDNNVKIRKIAGGAVSTYPTQFYGNRGMAVGTNGKLYFSTNVNYINTVKILDPQTGDHTVLAGKGMTGFAEGKGDQAQFAGPSGIAVDPQGTVFVVDSDNHRIRRITSDGTVTTIAGSIAGNADGVGADAKFSRPVGIVRDSDGNLYVTDLGNAAIRKLTPKP